MFYISCGIIMKNNNYNFDPADWQGRRQDQVESSYKIIGYSVIGLFIWLLVAAIIHIGT